MSVIQRFLYPGVVLGSVVVHSVVLMLPMASSPEAPPEEEEEVDIVQLAPLVKAPPTPPTPSPAPSAIAPSPRPTPAAATPRPQTTPIAAATPTPPAPTPSVSPAPSETPAVPFDPSAYQDQFFAGMQGIQGNIGVQPYPGAVDEPLAFFTSAENDGVPLPGIVGMQWFNDRKPDEVYPSLERSYQGSLTFNPLGDYGGGSLYEAKTPTNDTAFFLNIVPGRGGASTIVVTWSHNPTQPAPN
ncbi:MAG TPA: hypothetical protein V6C88_19135 [Chroococcidiopsis sp.]